MMDLYQNFLEVSKALQDAEVPTENRVMYYFVPSWWRHPIRRYRRWQEIRKLRRLDGEYNNW